VTWIGLLSFRLYSSTDSMSAPLPPVIVLVLPAVAANQSRPLSPSTGLPRPSRQA